MGDRLLAGCLVAGVGASSAVPDRLSYDFSLPGQEGYETSVKLIEAYGIDGGMSYVPVYTAPAGEKIADHREELAQIDGALAKLPGAHVSVTPRPETSGSSPRTGAAPTACSSPRPPRVSRTRSPTS